MDYSGCTSGFCFTDASVECGDFGSDCSSESVAVCGAEHGAQARSSSEWCCEASAVESLLSLIVDVKSLIRCFYAESSSRRTCFGFRLRGVLCSPWEGLGPHSDPGSWTVTSAPLPREHGLAEMWVTTEPCVEMDVVSDKILFRLPLMAVPSD